MSEARALIRNAMRAICASCGQRCASVTGSAASEASSSTTSVLSRCPCRHQLAVAANARVLCDSVSALSALRSRFRCTPHSEWCMRMPCTPYEYCSCVLLINLLVKVLRTMQTGEAKAKESAPRATRAAGLHSPICARCVRTSEQVLRQRKQPSCVAFVSTPARDCA